MTAVSQGLSLAQLGKKRKVPSSQAQIYFASFPYKEVQPLRAGPLLMRMAGYLYKHRASGFVTVILKTWDKVQVRQYLPLQAERWEADTGRPQPQNICRARLRSLVGK